MPGSQGPRQSGSVIVPTDVPTHTSTMSFGSHFTFLNGGGLQPLPPLFANFSSSPAPVDEFEFEEEPPPTDEDDDDEEEEMNVAVAAPPLPLAT